MNLSDLHVKIFADGADVDRMRALAAEPHIRGFTTNPTLMRKAGVTDYEQFARKVLDVITDMPISLEVIADDFDEMERQALLLSGLGPNVYVKIPASNTVGDPTTKLVRRLVEQDVQVNVTAIMTLDQVRWAVDALVGGPAAFVSVFAGRIADSGRDPVPLLAAMLELARQVPNVELIWSSPREILNVVQADTIGCDVITLTPDLLDKLSLLGRGLEMFSLETVRMFYEDAVASGFFL